MTITLHTTATTKRNKNKRAMTLSWRLQRGGMTRKEACTWAWAAIKHTDHEELGYHTLEMIAVFAARIQRLMSDQDDIDRATATIFAWDFVTNNSRHTHTLNLITFIKSNGEIITRLVDLNWSKSHEVTGAGRPLKPGQILMTDLAANFAGIRDTISTYENRILRAV